MDGILLVNKPKYITSNDLVVKVKKHLNEKVGHTGILDYAASGLMVLTVGKATRFTQFFQGLDKQYIAEGKLGEITDTYDSQGKVIQSNPVNINQDQLIQVINSFIGEYDQLPPPYSAKKIQGRRAYQLAKKGINPDLKPVRVKIYNIEILEINLPYFKIKVDCSSGTYIRSLIKDIGDKLSTGAYMSDLIRTKIGEFKLEDALELQDILDKKEVKLIPIKEALYFFQELELPSTLERAFKYGQKVKLDSELKGLFKVVNQEGQLLGLGKMEDGILKPEIVLS
ncbi:tRNA pseudouridine synthase B [Sulfurihydrogenibium azorense Az-Fu1]|jgi:tRNA pseudouridine55 synthase|uniref:tRNA pseudouridine synthase B n=1 Tax=Sulfurihydrogenibium azorense (strain DSM 15241 / OCM 825 / Az-Fu1) TaxID=204536 RepID=C1DV95_SULAA|nr:tRNA pseudouridine(55) synthase TruB [Sulfurihydrogenibium azorense]ACN99122.1 tRNA pseudouridine synthase B [Sulfurihydrogenibium azorense Az-Fu1]